MSVIKALVAVRAGSQRVRDKNIRPFADSSLLEIKLRQLLRNELLNGVIVNSDDDAMLDIAAGLGCETVKRDAFYASSSAPMSEVYKNMAEHCGCDVIVYANVTNPLLKDETLSGIISFYMQNRDKYDSVNSAHLVKEFMFRDNKPINYELKHQPRSQDLPDIYALNFAVSVLSREKMIDGMNVVGSVPYIFGIDEVEATDIDNPIDFEFAEYIYKKYYLTSQIDDNAQKANCTMGGGVINNIC
ncbi:MAG: hypothetical protein NC078_00435 [Ruminococcus sp.]|nr:hypothetical protein [Ruminococcus sp.]